MEILESMAGVAISEILWALHLSYPGTASATDVQGLSRKQQHYYLEALRYAGEADSLAPVARGFLDQFFLVPRLEALR